MNTNDHLSKPALVRKLDTTWTFEVVWRSISPIKASVRKQISPRWRETRRQSDVSLGQWRVYRAYLQGIRTSLFARIRIRL